MATEFNTLTSTLTTLIDAFSVGYANLIGDIDYLLYTLGGIEITLIGLYWALGGGERIVEVFKKVLFLFFWVWLVNEAPFLMDDFVFSLAEAGFTAGGNAGNLDLLLDPSRIAGYGIDATEKLGKEFEEVDWDVGDAIILGFCFLLIIACFFIIAIQVFLTVVEYYLITAMVGILLPFGIIKPTKFLAEKAIGAVIAAGVKMMVLAFLIAVIDPTLATITFTGDEIKLNEIFSVLLLSATFAFLCWNAPGMAAGLLSGSPSLSAGTALQNATSAVAMGAGAVAAGVGATAAAARGAVAAGGAAIRGAGAVASGAQMGASSANLASGGSKLSAFAGGLKGAGKAAFNNTAGKAADSMQSKMGAHFRVGQRDGYLATGGKLTEGMKSADAVDRSTINRSQSTNNSPGWANRVRKSMSNIPREAQPAGGSAIPSI